MTYKIIRIHKLFHTVDEYHSTHEEQTNNEFIYICFEESFEQQMIQKDIEFLKEYFWQAQTKLNTFTASHEQLYQFLLLIVSILSDVITTGTLKGFVEKLCTEYKAKYVI